jgi:hypothetical protein
VSATLETPRSTAATTGRAVQQHPLWLSVLLHLLPGAALTGFIVVMHAAFGVEPLLALLAGILVVLAPLELGYLALHARRTTGSWSRAARGGGAPTRPPKPPGGRLATTRTDTVATTT